VRWTPKGLKWLRHYFYYIGNDNDNDDNDNDNNNEMKVQEIIYVGQTTIVLHQG